MDRPGIFAATFVALFALSFAFLWAVNALPNMETGFRTSSPSGSAGQTLAPQGPASYPTRVVATSIGLDAAVVNPQSTDVDVLDKALEQGAVRYPTSALLGQDGTVLIFGHSSYLPVVYHQYYKTFDGIQNLKKGAIVSVFAGNAEYRYSVTSVTLANAEQDVVELPQTGTHLVLVTCDSFATKSTRYVVKADLVGE
jgi:LPXTG-site transpeptidase (sortase) family protein